MEETANAQANETQAPAEATEKMFTQDELNNIVSERVNKELARAERRQEASKAELQEATDKASRLEAELAGYKQAEELRQIKVSISEKTGIPVRLLNGETEETCEAQANAIKEYVAEQIEEARNNGYPMLKDAGEVHPASRKQSTDEQFAEWMKKIMK